MFDRCLSRMPRVLNMAGFWIWHVRIWKAYTEFRICLNMAQYASMIHENARKCFYMSYSRWICLNMDGYCGMLWICLKNAWINCSDYVKVLNMPLHLRSLTGFWVASDLEYTRVLNMLQYSYNNMIIIITNVIILDFLFYRFVHPGARQLTILYFLIRVTT